jgi:glutaredoxin 3
VTLIKRYERVVTSIVEIGEMWARFDRPLAMAAPARPLHTTVYTMGQQRIVMYATPWCPYCWRAKQLLSDKGYAFDVIEVSNDERTRRWLVEQTGRRTVPQIKIGERWVGGFDDIDELDAKGELDRIIAGAA